MFTYNTYLYVCSKAKKKLGFLASVPVVRVYSGACTADGCCRRWAELIYSVVTTTISIQTI